jgi:hypothetical protein
MLPKDSKARREKAKANAQTSLDPHLEEMPIKKCVVPYSDALFQRVTIEWLVSTDQVCNKLLRWCLCLSKLPFKPIDALSHPKFHEMIDVASRAPAGVNIPGRKQTRKEILGTFKTHLTKLREHLNVRPIISEMITADVFTGAALEQTDTWFYQSDVRCLAGK